MPRITHLDHIVLTVADIDQSVAFYRDALGMEVEHFAVADGSTRTALRFGSHKINLQAARSPFKPHAHVPLPGTADLCFVTETPLTDWLEKLASLNIPIIEGPVKRTGANGPLQSLYIRDPDLNLLEISTYE